MAGAGFDGCAAAGAASIGWLALAMVEEIDRALGMAWNLANEPRIQEAMVQISELENQGDALYGAVIADLFRQNGRNPVEILKWKEVYDGLEEACDGCKDFTHVLADVVIKST
jgi:uncharacterized protein Yka (UPF0111/DUF47 family)